MSRVAELSDSKFQMQETIVEDLTRNWMGHPVRHPARVERTSVIINYKDEMSGYILILHFQMRP